MPAWFGGRPRGKGPAQQAPRRAAHPVLRRSRDREDHPTARTRHKHVQAAPHAFLSRRGTPAGIPATATPVTSGAHGFAAEGDSLAVAGHAMSVQSAASTSPPLPRGRMGWIDPGSPAGRARGRRADCSCADKLRPCADRVGAVGPEGPRQCAESARRRAPGVDPLR
jgi:hypothetical protein